MKRRAFCAAALGLIMAGPALAQGQGGGPGGRPGFGGPGGPGGFRMGGGLSGLLRMPEVQKELKLDQTQVELLQGIRPAGPGFGGPGGPGGRPGGPGGPGGFNREDFERRMAQARQEEEKKIAEVLDAKQMARLKQLDLQRQGLRVITRPDVATALKLTPDQKQKVEAALQAERETMRATFEAARGNGDAPPDFQAIRTKMQEMRSGTDAKLNAILTGAQKSQLQSMQGAPFKFPEPRFGPGGPGFGRPGGGRPNQ